MLSDSFILVFMLIFSCFKSGFLYQEVLLDQSKVCDVALNKRSLKLGYENKSGIILSPKDYLSTLSGKYSFQCTFTVEGIAGVVAVIQYMKFRSEVSKNTGLTTCIDYIQFSPADRSPLAKLNILQPHRRQWSEKFCGNVDLREKGGLNDAPSEGSKSNVSYAGTPIGQNTYVQEGEAMDVKIYIEAQTIDPKNEPGLKIAFTAFQPCKYDLGHYRMCGGKMCIWHEFFNDEIVNCPFIHCTDEFSCNSESTDRRSIATGLGTRVLLGAVAGIFTMMFVLILFFWTFHYCSFLCQNKPSLGRVEIPQVPTQENTTMLAEIVTAGGEGRDDNKDLPPSYDSLFPISSTPNPSTSPR